MTLHSKLGRKTEEQKALVSEIEKLMIGRAPVDPNWSIEYFPIDSSPFKLGQNVTMEIVGEYLERHHGLSNESVLATWRPGRNAVIVVLQHERPESIANTMLKRLADDAKRQFSATRPAVMCVHLAEMKTEQMRANRTSRTSRTKTELQIVASDILTRRPHLHAVAITIDGTIVHGTGSSRESGLCYFYKNPHSRWGNIPLIDSMFGDELGT